MQTDELLTADELEALWAEMPSGSATVPIGGAEPYDFGSSEFVIRSLVPILSSIVDRVADEFRSRLLRELRRELEVTPGVPVMHTLPEFMTTLSEPCSTSLVQIDGLSGVAVVSVDRPLVFSLVDLFFGARSATPRIPCTRDFTDTERRMIGRLRTLCFEALNEGWREVVPAAQCRLLREEHNPQFLAHQSTAEMLIVCPLRVCIEEPTGEINLAFPYSMLEPLRELVLAGVQVRNAGSAAHLSSRWQTAIEEASVRLCCPLTHAEISVGELLRLKVGDVLPIDLPERVRVEVDRLPLFEGSYGMCKGKRAVKIVAVRSEGSRRALDPYPAGADAQ